MNSHLNPEDRRVVELEAASGKPVKLYKTVTEASRDSTLSRTSIYNAINDGSVCNGSRWSWASVYETHVALHGGVVLSELIAPKS